jgi:hypothetical protein
MDVFHKGGGFEMVEKGITEMLGRSETNIDMWANGEAEGVG